MQLWTYGNARQKILRECDIQDENFIEPETMLEWFNDAIDEAEAAVIELHEDYLLTSDWLALVDGEDHYDMPTNIFADKMRHVSYADGQNRYVIKKIKIQDISAVEDGEPFQYNIEYDNDGQKPEFVLYPAADQTSSELVRRWYVRNLMRVEEDGDNIDLPEFIQFIFAHVKEKVMLTQGHPRHQLQIMERDRQKGLMIATLKSRVLDGSGTVWEADTEFYEEHE